MAIVDVKFIKGTDAASALRAALKRAFPGAHISVRTVRSSTSVDIEVSWTDGPTTAEVEAITAAHQGNQVIDGHFVHYGVSTVTVQRAYSSAMQASIEAALAEELGQPFQRGRFYPEQGEYGSALFWQRFSTTSAGGLTTAVAA